ncbi:DUF1642 domain-containing protein [Lacticaseibacillus paracasei]|uniref:DUF1642 domain-containing protein n=1 Tax=Lacticaseibacillus paracasei TaxID=1597 RepID=UPI00202FCE05|nr:DUF1642 domain-containing protein [Lacticaseibacillus paracasei]URW92554.1 DUF1642 domain-containing protein [Lacticaseibacillus paracasei]
MSSETKRDVLLYFGDYVLRNFNTPNIIFGGEQVAEYMQRYDAALPDDLPVIPESVGEWIKKCKLEGATLADTLCMEMRPQTVRWWMEFKDGKIAKGFDSAGYRRKQETMAKAWVLGVWCVEETDEIVKLEAEK